MFQIKKNNEKDTNVFAGNKEQKIAVGWKEEEMSEEDRELNF